MQSRAFTGVLFISCVAPLLLSSCVSTDVQPDHGDRPVLMTGTATQTDADHPITESDSSFIDVDVEDEQSSFLQERTSLLESFESEALDPTALLNEARANLSERQTDLAISNLRKALEIDASHLEVRSLLIELLSKQGRHSEVVTLIDSEISTVRLQIDDYTHLLNALREIGADFQLAMTAEEAVAAYPAHTPFLLMTVEALIAVDAYDKAWKYWARLPSAMSKKSHAQWLLGQIHERRDEIAQAWVAYRQVGSYPYVASALMNLENSRIQFGGWSFFPPRHWMIISKGNPAIFLESGEGIELELTMVRDTSVESAAQHILSSFFDVPKQDLVMLIRGGRSEAAPWLKSATFNCQSDFDAVCLHVGADAEFSDFVQSIHLISFQIGSEVFVTSVLGADSDASIAAIQKLAQRNRFVQEN